MDCNNCIYFQMITEQPDYLVNGKEAKICAMYKDGIDQNKTMCEHETSAQPEIK